MARDAVNSLQNLLQLNEENCLTQNVKSGKAEEHCCRVKEEEKIKEISDY